MRKKGSRKPYTQKKYIRGVKPSEITRFEFGEDKDYQLKVSLVSLQNGEISDRALESFRVAVRRILTQTVEKAYYFKIKAYPHHITRRHKALSFAGADRLSKGMRLSFGKVDGCAARVKRGQTISYVKGGLNTASFLKQALHEGQGKLPLKTKIVVRGAGGERGETSSNDSVGD
ncbi:MAG: 50S ribosomal protein L16 [Candidatus Bathyarchaeia archaeon]